MADTPMTARFSTPLSAIAQAQKEVPHNEALTMLDALAVPTAEAGPQTEMPVPGRHGWPTIAWAVEVGMLALWTEGGWRLVARRAEMRVTRLD